VIFILFYSYELTERVVYQFFFGARVIKVIVTLSLCFESHAMNGGMEVNINFWLLHRVVLYVLTKSYLEYGGSNFLKIVHNHIKISTIL
jgi:hypothetical protein